jgi:CO/xanthine dehydrogenase FAD-binding subunit
VIETFQPGTLADALATKAEWPDAVPIAGGTDLMVELNARRARPPMLLDLSRVDELATWRRDDGVVFLGAGMTFARIARELTEFPPLVQAARSVGSVQIVNRATVGGNLATASPAGDSLPVLAAYDAKVVAASLYHTRRLALADFLTGPKRTALAPEELIIGVEWHPVRGRGSFAKVGVRNAMVIAIASVCLQHDDESGGVRLALGSVGPTVLRASRAEAFAVETHDPAEFGRLAADEAQPITDVRASAAYRRHVVEVLARRALEGRNGC